MEGAVAIAQRRRMSPTPPPAPTGNRSPAISVERVKLAEYDRQNWVVNVEPGQTVEDLKRPDYWCHVAQQLSPYDHIEARAEDGSWIADLIVVRAESRWAKVLVKDVIVLEEDDTEGSELHSVKWHGPQHKWSIFSAANGEIVRDGFKTKGEAEAWRIDHEKTLST